MPRSESSEYLNFAASLSFFEFSQLEFKGASFPTEKYGEEIELLQAREAWNKEDLAEFFIHHPKGFTVLEQVFQQSRFTNTQMIHFLFDVSILNSSDETVQIAYLKKNQEQDEQFANILGEVKIDDNGNKSVIYNLKQTVVNYVAKAIKKEEFLWNRIINRQFSDCSLRIAEYLIEKQHLNDRLEGLKLNNYLKKKRLPLDTKSLHGKFGKQKIKKVLEELRITNIDEQLKGTKDVLKIKTDLNFKATIAFCTEKSAGVKGEESKLKKFDAIVLNNKKPWIVIETNFYSTSGTKIGINDGEYVKINKEIEKKHKELVFLWITDGNYWLTSDGKERFHKLYPIFGDRLLTYNLARKKLSELVTVN